MVHFCYLRPYVDIETVSWRLLQRMTRMEMDWKLKKSWAILFQFQYSNYAWKNHQQKWLWLLLSYIFFITLQEQLCKGLR